MPKKVLAVILDKPGPFADLKKGLSRKEEQFLFQVLTAYGFSFDEWSVSYVYAIPQRFEKVGIDACRARHIDLLAEVTKLRPDKILCLGAVAFATLAKSKKIPNARKVGGFSFMLALLNGVDVYTVATIAPYLVLVNPDLHRDFCNAIDKIITNDDPRPAPIIDMMVAQTANDVLIGLHKLLEFEVISCDTETTGLNPRIDKIDALGFGALTSHGGRQISSITVIIPRKLLEDNQVKAVIIDFLATRFTGKVVFHNAKFDLQFIATWAGHDFPDMQVYDTLLMNYLLDERSINSADSPHGLKTITQYRYDVEDYKFSFTEFWSLPEEERDWDSLYRYLSLDLAFTARLFEDLEMELKADNPKSIPLLEELLMPACKALAMIELRGTLIDVDYFKSFEQELETDMQDILSEANAILSALHISVGGKKGFNIGSPKQVGDILFGYFGLPAGSERSTNKEALHTYLSLLKEESQGTGRSLLNKKDEGTRAAQARFIECILDYRDITKVLSTYVKGLLGVADTENRVHTQFNLAGTQTGRLSANSPALQTIPQMKGLEVRRGFIVPPDYVFMKADYSQLELRVAAFITQDERMIQAYRDDRDIHIEVASAMFGVPATEIAERLAAKDPQAKAWRYAAKFVDFGILYGRHAKSIAYGPELRDYGWSERDAQKFIDRYLGQFPGLKTWMEDTQKAAVTDHELETPLGRRRRWSLITNANYLDVQRQALNFPIQSTASDFTLTSLVKLTKKLRPMKSHILMTVHDEIDLAVHMSELSVVAQMVQETMTKELPIDCNVPIVAEIEIGQNWADLKPYKEYLLS